MFYNYELPAIRGSKSIKNGINVTIEHQKKLR